MQGLAVLIVGALLVMNNYCFTIGRGFITQPAARRFSLESPFRQRRLAVNCGPGRSRS
ncbi:MAG: hypothetical protein IPH08_03030 [Rhodocyclaceae bacterium]|nr:hypothetical protein [Rhodocyclaceae bacterium]